jgi:hypothetical protein
MGVACSAHGDVKSEYKFVIVKSERKSPLGRPNCRWEYNINMVL